MSKLRNIIRIIATYGSLDIADLEDESPPIINSINKNHCQLGERFYIKGIDVTTYVHDRAVGEDFIEYENIDDSIIEMIHELVVKYEDKMKANTVFEKCTRVEVIDEKGRSYHNWDKNNIVEISLQDNERTLKVFIYKKREKVSSCCNTKVIMADSYGRGKCSACGKDCISI